MVKKILILIFTVCFIKVQAQVENDTIDYNYLEDQLYLTLSYNILVNKPKDDTNFLFSGGFSMGFIKDIPINKQRNFGIGVGLGYAFNSYKNNIVLFTDSGNSIDEEYKTNKLSANLVELPIEFRWRTSTPTKYSFWRVYGGVKLAYSFYSMAKFESNGEIVKIKNSEEYNRFQYGIMLSAGYGTWNIYSYYGLNNLFHAYDVNGNKLETKDFNIGLKFYIL
jgi:hypothetical protein